jgi:hypothetical protein
MENTYRKSTGFELLKFLFFIKFGHHSKSIFTYCFWLWFLTKGSPPRPRGHARDGDTCSRVQRIQRPFLTVALAGTGWQIPGATLRAIPEFLKWRLNQEVARPDRMESWNKRGKEIGLFPKSWPDVFRTILNGHAAVPVCAVSQLLKLQIMSLSFAWFGHWWQNR